MNDRARLPWTHEELQGLKSRLREQIQAAQESHPDARPLPPMTVDDCLDHVAALAETAVKRPLTPAESFMIGQLLANLIMAVRAEMLGKKGRYFVLSEDDVARRLKA